MELAKKKKKSMKEQPFKPEVDTGIEKPVTGKTEKKLKNF